MNIRSRPNIKAFSYIPGRFLEPIEALTHDRGGLDNDSSWYLQGPLPLFPLLLHIDTLILQYTVNAQDIKEGPLPFQEPFYIIIIMLSVLPPMLSVISHYVF
jgi:hypothetical protein